MINIYGNGGHAKVITSALSDTDSRKIKFWDDESYEKEIGVSTVGPDFFGKWIIAIGSNEARKRISQFIRKEFFITIIDKSAIVNSNCTIGEGSQILHGAVVQTDTTIGKHCIVNTAASIDHDCILGDFSFVGPNATLCGGVEIGEGTFIGAGAVIIPHIKIGKNCTIGAGAVVIKDIPDGVTAVGNPAEIKL